MRHRRIVTLVVLAGALGGGCRSDGGGATPSTVPATAAARAANATVVRVIDGDTIDADFAGPSERMRLSASTRPRRQEAEHPIECFGPEASALHQAAADRGHRGAAGPRPRGARRLRPPAGLRLPSRDGMFVNLELVADGLSPRRSTFPPNDAHAGEFVARRRAPRPLTWPLGGLQRITSPPAPIESPRLHSPNAWDTPPSPARDHLLRRPRLLPRRERGRLRGAARRRRRPAHH